MVNVTTSTQLSVLFSTIRTSLLSSSTIAGYMTTQDFYQFDPNFKQVKYPHIQIELPSTDTDLLTMNHATTLKTFTIPIILRVEFIAKDNHSTIAQAIINQLESDEATFDALGYYDLSIDLVDTDGGVELDQKRVIISNFELSFNGGIDR